MRLTIITTGGTIEKTYNEYEGSLKNDRSVLNEIMALLRIPDLFIRHSAVLHKDSLEMTNEDRGLIANGVIEALPLADAVLILHGTDTLAVTGDYLFKQIENVSVPVILTGAMRPYEFRDSDAVQNVTESLLAARYLSAGIYTVMHNRILKFPGIEKDREKLTFRYLT